MPNWIIECGHAWKGVKLSVSKYCLDSQSQVSHMRKNKKGIIYFVLNQPNLPFHNPEQEDMLFSNPRQVRHPLLLWISVHIVLYIWKKIICGPKRIKSIYTCVVTQVLCANPYKFYIHVVFQSHTTHVGNNTICHHSHQVRMQYMRYSILRSTCVGFYKQFPIWFWSYTN